MPYLILFVFSAVVFVSCNRKKSGDANQIAIARVYDKYLYLEDIKDVVPKGTSPKDSAVIIKSHIDNWIRTTLLTQQAENNLTDEQKDVENQLQDYRNSLITYIYEKELVKQKLDTVVADNEIEEYYEKNQGNFELKDNIIKVVYVKVNKKAPGVNDVKRWYKSDNEKDKEKLKEYCRQFAENFYLDDTSWLLFDDLLKEVPIQAYNEELFLQNNRFVEVGDSTNLYFLNIKGFKIRNSRSPLSFEKENIKNIILNKRKLQLINKMKEDIYNEAFNSNDIETYSNEADK